MSLGKLILVVVFLFSSSAFAQKTAPAAPKGATKAKREVRTQKKFSFGLGFMAFGEPLQINDGTQLDNGYATYAGLVALIDHTWTRNRWIHQVGGGFGSGKGSAGGFSSISYPDAGRRTYTFSFLEFASHYRLNSRISIGAGLIAGNRSADWKSTANPAVKTKSLNKVVYAPELVFRWAVTRNVTLIQSLASPDLRGNTIWRWSANCSL